MNGAIGGYFDSVWAAIRDSDVRHRRVAALRQRAERRDREQIDAAALRCEKVAVEGSEGSEATRRPRASVGSKKKGSGLSKALPQTRRGMKLEHPELNEGCVLHPWRYIYMDISMASMGVDALNRQLLRGAEARLVFPMHSWTLEAAAGTGELILTLKMPDGLVLETPGGQKVTLKDEPGAV